LSAALTYMETSQCPNGEALAHNPLTVHPANTNRIGQARTVTNRQAVADYGQGVLPASVSFDDIGALLSQ